MVAGNARRALLATLALGAALALAGCGGSSSTSTGATPATNATSEAAVREIGLVSAYCLYRADTQAQMEACEARTEAAQVRSADEEAARWARGELRACGKSAGELCQYYRGR